MRKSLLIILVFCARLGIASAQDMRYPVLPATGKDLEAFIPKDWKVIAQSMGDLNGDKATDLVFVLQAKDKKNIVLNEEGIGQDTLDTNPRILGIVFKDKSSGNYNLILQSNTFILRHEDAVMDDPFDGISIEKNGVLKIRFRFWYSAGSWYMSNHNYKFRLQNNRFELIGYDANETHRASGETTEHSINFSTGKMITTKGNIESDEPASKKTSTFKLRNLKNFESLKEPFTWDFQGIKL